MHLGNAAITPECALLACGAAAGGLGLAAVAARQEPLTRHKLALAAAGGSLIFAAQAINVPVLPGASAHLVGGVLLAWALGPGLGAWTMTIVLAVQALALGDGGLLALGANVLNMALLPAGLVAAGRRWMSVSESSWKARFSLAAIGALSVPLAAGMLVVETAAFRSGAELAAWSEFAARMLATHLWIGLAEGGLTFALAVGFAWLTSRADARSAWRAVWVSLAGALVLAGFVSAWSSSLPDGYEAAAESSGRAQLLAEVAAWQSPIAAQLGQISGGDAAALVIATMLCGLLTAAAATSLAAGASSKPAAAS